jgi:hypothetical protein
LAADFSFVDSGALHAAARNKILKQIEVKKEHVLLDTSDLKMRLRT